MNSANLQDQISGKSPVLLFYLAWGYMLWWSVAANGLGTSRDSVEYLFTSLSLSKGDGFISFQGQPYVLWPPLYPILLSLVNVAGVSDPFRAALVLQLFTFVWLIALLHLLFSRMFLKSFALDFTGNVFAGTGVAVTALFQTVGSDYLFVALTLSMIYLCYSYITDNRIRTLWLMMLVSTLAMLQRYIGITVLCTGAWVVFYYTRAAIWEKLKRLILLGLSIIPVVIWAFSLPAEALVRGGASSPLENMYGFTLSVLSWFIPNSQLDSHPVRLQFGMWGFWLGIIAGSLFVWRFRKRSSGVATVGIPMFLFGATYTVALLSIASLSSFNWLDSRLVSPIFIPLVFLLVATIEIIFSFEFIKGYMQKALRTVGYLPLLILLGLSGYQSVTSIKLHRAVGEGYTSSDWNHNSVISYWLSHPADDEYLIFSNYPAGVAAHTWHVTLPSPRRTAHPNVGEEAIPLETFFPSLFDPEKVSYLVWIEPNEYTHVYTVDDLRSIVNVETIYESEDGGIYRILPP